VTLYTLFGQVPAPALTADATGYTMGVQFSVSQAGTYTGVWFYSAAGAAALPSKVRLYAVSGQAVIVDQVAAWSGIAGSGWVRAPVTSPPALTAGTASKAAVLQGSAVNWYASAAHYWDTGAGQNGISNGPLSAPNNANSAQGQDSFLAGDGYPNSSFNATNYWVDPEVSVAAAVVVTAQQQQSGRSMMRKRLMYADV